MKNFQAVILANELLTEEYGWMVFETEEKFLPVLPGQFLHILCRSQAAYDPLLRRPFSIYKCRICEDRTRFEILYKIVGRGTELLSRFRMDEPIDVVGPMGNAFSVPENVRSIALIGGGVGIPPLIFLASALKSKTDIEVTAYIGGRREQDLLCREDVALLDLEHYYSTEDGSEGFEGYITQCFLKNLAEGKSYDRVYSCGPTGMLQAVQKICLEKNIEHELCIEEQMGCGLGVCLSCVVRTDEGLKRVCKEGPVFNGKNLKWDWRDPRVNLVDLVRSEKPVYKADLSVDLGKLKLKNPIITASGTFGYGEEFADVMDLSMLGAIAVKGITLKPREGNRQQRLTETPAGLLNSIGLQNYGVDEFIARMLPKARSYHVPVIVNISGEKIEDYGECAKRLDAAEGVDAIEINISCPNVAAGCMEFGTDPLMAAKVVDVVRKNTKRFCIVKLSPNVTDIVAIAKACEEHGAESLSLVNTFLGMAIDPGTARPILGRTMGGLSGPAIKPIALRMIWQVYEATKLPIMGMGGIMNLDDALEFAFAGSKVISLGTVNFIQPRMAEDLLIALTTYLVENRIAKFTDIVGLSHKFGDRDS